VNRPPPPGRTGLRFSTVAAIYAPALVIIGLSLLLSATADVPIEVLVRDPTTTLRGHALTGLQSHLGVLVWWAAASICLFCGAILWRAATQPRLRSFLIWSGVITAVLAADDLFLFHEELAWQYLRLDERIILLAYGVVVAWYLLRFRMIILDSEYPLLLAAFLLLGSSIAMDQFVGDRWASSWRIVIEDGLKLLGIASWSGYLILASARALTPSSPAPSHP
jgi:hypothetical protein